MDRTALTRQAWTQLEPLHVLSYFAPETIAGYTAAGLKGYWMGYFAGRSAPFGAVGPDLVAATFYNWDPAHIARAIPDAWSHASPEAVLAVRLETAVAAPRRVLAGQEAVIGEAAELAARAASTAPLDGRPLYAALHQLPWPDDDLGRLWHAATLLREQRGDGHIAVLVAADIGGRLAGVLNGLAKGVGLSVLSGTRRYDDAEWAAQVAELEDRGWAADGALTELGRSQRADLEATTDRLAARAYDALSDEELARLVELTAPLAAAVVASGEIPGETNQTGSDAG